MTIEQCRPGTPVTNTRQGDATVKGNAGSMILLTRPDGSDLYLHPSDLAQWHLSPRCTQSTPAKKS